MKPGFALEPEVLDLRGIVQHFEFEGDYLGAVSYGMGHIHDSYAACFRRADGEVHRYLLQQINHHVFENPKELMQNIERVTAHLRTKIADAGGDPRRQTLNLIGTTEGGTLHRAPDRSYWRAYLFIEGAQTYEVPEHADHVYHAARAYGDFQKLLADFPAEELHQTIPGFHDTRKRFEAFVGALERDAVNRARDVHAEIEFVEQRAVDTCVLLDLLDGGELPERVTHNDTKFDNVMIDDATGEGVCVIDLDTVMPGLALYDFGDAVRSGANPVAEDELDLSKVSFDFGVFERLTQGYMDAARAFLTPQEIGHLAFSARLITLECGMRFLTDYLEGDPYFKVHRQNHNLDRCRTQFKLVQDMEDGFEQMRRIVDRYR
jgi:Ser/Thr protein kinase RdoA (MazF antagonist)